MPRLAISILLACVWFAPLIRPTPSAAAELSGATIQAWDRYVIQANHLMEERLATGRHFLMIDERADRLDKVRNGAIVAWPSQGNGRSEVSGGLIHHWVGAVYIPNTNLDTVFDVLDDYDSYKSYYSPTVVASAGVDENGSYRKFSMRVVKRVLFITAAVDAQYGSVHHRIGAKRWYTITNSTRIQEIQKLGTSKERILPPDAGNGYVWRLCGISRVEERGGGVYVEVEAIALTRTVPAYAAWFVNPAVDQLSRNALVTSLSQTRDAVRSYSRPVQQLVRR